MSTKVENRIVSMKFDNKTFNSGVETTIKSLDRLKEKLSFKGVGKGFKDIENSANGVKMGGLSSSIDGVQSKFSAMDVFAFSVFQRISNYAIDAGEKLVKAFTLDPILSGFQEYETQINAVQTILANTSSKGTTLNQVNAALDELNRYADMTIYNFTEMTRNIGTFTAAGVDLDKSVQSIKGIANLAAMSGSTSMQASTAMYQLSQAIAAGRVQLQDWNSVVNAGMGGEVFQNALKRTATVMGTNVDALIQKYGSFRESLTQGQWLTTEVLTETLGQFAGAYTDAELIAKGYSEQQVRDIQQMAQTATDAATKVKTLSQLFDTLKEAAQSGWTQSWELIVGDFEQAKELFTWLSDTFSTIINNSANARNALLEDALGPQWDKLAKEVSDSGIAVDEFKNKLIETAKEHGVAVDEMISKNGSFEASLKEGWMTSDIVVETINKFVDSAQNGTKATEDLNGKLDEFQKITDKIWNGEFKNGEDRVKALTDAGYDYAKCQDLINKTVDGHRLTLEDLSDVQLKSIGYTDEEISKIKQLGEEANTTGSSLQKLIERASKPTGRDLLVDTLKNNITAIIKLTSAISNAWHEVFKPLQGEQVYGFLEGINKISKALVMTDDTADNLKRTLKGVFSILHLITSIGTGALTISFKLLSHVLGLFNLDILSFTAYIGDAITAIDQWIHSDNILVKAFDYVIKAAVEAGKAVYGFYEYVINNEKVISVVESVQDSFESLYKVGSECFGNIKESIQLFIDDLNSLDGISLENISKAIGMFKKDVLGNFDDYAKTFSDSIIDAYKRVVSELEYYIKKSSDAVSKIKGIFTNLISFIKEKIGNINLGSILTIGLGMGLFKFITALSKMAEKLADLYETISSVFNGIGAVIENVGNVLKSFALKVKAEALLTIAKAIGILVGSLFLLAQIPQDKLWESVKVLEVLILSLTVLSATLSAMGKFAKIGIPSLSITSVAASILILASALKIMDGLNTSNVMKNVAALGILIVGLTGLSSLMSKFTPTMFTGGGTLILMAISIRILIKSLKDIDKINPGSLTKSIGTMTTIMVALGMMSRMVSGVNLASFTSIIAIAISIRMLAKSLKSLSSLDTVTINKGINALVPIMLSLAVLLKITNLAGGNALKAGGSMILISTAMIVMTTAIKKLSEISNEQLNGATNAITRIMLLFTLMTAITKSAGQNAGKAGGMMLSFAGAMVMLSGAIMLLAEIRDDKLDKATNAIIKIGAMFGLLIGMTHFAGDASRNIRNIGLAIALMSGSVALLTLLNQDDVERATKSIMGIMGMMSILELTSKYANFSIKGIATISAVAGMLVGVLTIISKINPKASIDNVVALSVLLTAMTINLTLLSKIQRISPMAMLGLATITTITTGLALILKGMDNFVNDSALQNAEALSLLLGTLTACCGVLSVVGMTGIAGIKGVGVLATLVAAMGGVMAGIGYLVDKFPYLEDFVNNSIPLMEALGYGIGSFMGSIIGGFTAGATSGLPEIGEHLSGFMDSVGPFLEGIKNVDSSTIDSVQNLSESMESLAKAKFIDMFTNDDYSQFTEQLKSLGNGLVEFSTIVSGNIDEKAVESAANLGRMLTELSNNIPASGGLLQRFVGEIDIEGFSNQLKSLGRGLVDFSTVVSGNINEDAVNAAVSCGRMLTELANTIPATDGLAQMFMGEIDIEGFGEQLKSLGKGLVAFSNTVGNNINEDAVAAAVNAGKMITELANSIPSSGGLIEFLTGQNDIEEFSGQLKSLGQGIVEFSTIVSGSVNEDAVNAAVNCGKMITELANSVPSSGGLFSFFTGDNSLEGFADQLCTLGQGMAQFSLQVSDIDPGMLNAMCDSIGKLTEMFGRFESIDPSLTENFTTALRNVGDGLVYCMSMEVANPDTIITITDSINSLLNVLASMAEVDFSGTNSFKDAMTSLGETSVDGFVNSLADGQSKASSAIDEIMMSMTSEVQNGSSELSYAMESVLSSAINTITGYTAQFMDAGRQCMIALTNGLTLGIGNVITSFSFVLDACVSGIRSKYGAFYNAGAYLVDGFAGGISANSYSAQARAAAMAQAAIDAAKTTLDIHSPSRVFKKLGGYVSEGFAIGISNSTDLVTDAVDALGQNAINQMNGTNDILDELSSIDNTFVIRPVIDMDSFNELVDDLNGRWSILGLRNLNSVSSFNSDYNTSSDLTTLSQIAKSLEDIASSNEVIANKEDTFNINSEITMDNKAVGRMTAKYVREQNNKVEKINNRRRGLI